jgi:DNA repair ATPase RecN
MEIELKDAISYANEPGKIIDPAMCNYAMAVINGKIMDEEENEFELRLKVDQRHDELFDLYKVNAVADRKIKLDPLFIAWKKAEREVGRLKRLRRTLADRFQVLTMTKKY